MSFKLAVAASVAALASTVSAHGYLSKISVDGTDYQGYNHNEMAYSGIPDGTIGWSDTVSDNGYISNGEYSSPDIICHRGSEPAKASAKVNGGDTVTFQWNTWPEDHRGPVITYLANCNGDCSQADKNSLKWFKIDAGGLLSGDSAGTGWASDKIVQDGFKYDVKIPDSIASGNYVARHEIIALHTQYQPQNYPQCVNLEINSSGSDNPEGVVGTALYTNQDQGLNLNIWWPLLTEYPIPGPALYEAGSGSGSAPAPSSAWSAPASSTQAWSAPASSAPAQNNYVAASSSPAAWSAPAYTEAASSPVWSAPPAPPAPQVTTAPAVEDDVVYVTDVVYATAYTTVYTPQRRHAARHARLREARK